MIEQKHIALSSFESKDVYNLLSSQDDKYTSFYCIAKKNRDEIVPVISRTNKELTTFVQNELYLLDNTDYYITKNSCVHPNNWSIDNMFCFNNIVIDVDNHTSKIDCEELKTDLSRLIGEVSIHFEDLGLSAPNMVTFTGRGFQFLWHLESVATCYEDAYTAVTKKYMGILERFFDCNEEYTDFSVDEIASVKLQGLIRLPGSYSTKADTSTSCIIWHTNSLDLAKEYDRFDISRPKAVNYSHKKTTGEIAETRLKMLKKLFRFRGNIEKGMRNEFLFIYAVHLFLLGLSDDEVLRRVKNMNENFRYPLQDREILSIVKSSSKKNYSYTNSTIIERLNITDEEQKKLDFYPVGKVIRNAKRKAENTEKKAVRDNNILKLFFEQKSISEIARILSLARNTVSKVIQGFKNRCEDIKAKNREVFEKALAAKEKEAVGMRFPLIFEFLFDKFDVENIFEPTNLRCCT